MEWGSELYPFHHDDRGCTKEEWGSELYLFHHDDRLMMVHEGGVGVGVIPLSS